MARPPGCYGLTGCNPTEPPPRLFLQTLLTGIGEARLLLHRVE